MALTAIPVGFVAGLFGIGGGLITVPFLYYIFNQLGVDPQYVMHLAVGTSFAIIIPTPIIIPPINNERTVNSPTICISPKLCRNSKTIILTPSP